MDDEFVNEAPRWAYVGVFLLASSVWGLSVLLFLFTIGKSIYFPVDYYQSIALSIFAYISLTVTFVAIYSSSTRLRAINAARWLLVISSLCVAGLVIGHVKIDTALPSAFAYQSVIALNIGGILLSNAFFYLWAKRRDTVVWAPAAGSVAPAAQSVKADTADMLLPYLKKMPPLMRTSPGDGPARPMPPGNLADGSGKGRPCENAPDEQASIEELVKRVSSDQVKMDNLLAQYPVAGKAIEYLKEARTAWNEIQGLPSRYKESFLSALERDPDTDPLAEADMLLRTREKELNPFDQDDLNAAYAGARLIGRDAAREFREVASIFGNRITPAEILDKVKEKFKDRTRILEELMAACKLQDETEIERNISLLGFHIEFFDSHRGTRSFVISTPDSGESILMGDLRGIRSHILENAQLVEALNLKNEVRSLILNNVKKEENLAAAIEMIDERRIVASLRALDFDVKGSRLGDIPFYEITDKASGKYSKIEDFVSLRKFAKDVIGRMSVTRATAGR